MSYDFKLALLAMRRAIIIIFINTTTKTNDNNNNNDSNNNIIIKICVRIKSLQKDLTCESWKFESYELPHGKTNKMTLRPAKAQISLGIRLVYSEYSLCAQWVTKDPRSLHADS